MRISWSAIRLLGITRLSLLRVRRWVVRQVMSTTRPSVSLNRIQSLMRNGRSRLMTMPAKKLPRIGCSAKPRTSEVTALVATRAVISQFGQIVLAVTRAVTM